MDSSKVSVQELLAVEPLTDFKILGGWSGRHNAVKELASQLPLGEKTAETLLVLNCSRLNNQEVLAIIKKVLEKPLAGIFLIGTLEISLEKYLIDAAAAANIPIVQLQEVTHITCITEVYHLIQKLKESGFFLKFVLSSNSFLIKMLNNKGISALVTYLETILDNRVIIANSLFEPISLNDYQPQEPEYWKSRLKLIKKQYYKTSVPQDNLTDCSRFRYDLHQVSVNSANEDITTGFYISKLVTSSTDFGFLIVEESLNKLNKLNLVQLIQASPPLVSELVKINEILETTRKYKQNFIYDLLYNNFESHSSLVSQGKIWGWDLLKPHHLLIMEFQQLDQQKMAENVPLMINNTINSFFPKSITSEIEGKIVIIIPEADEKDRRDHKKHIKALIGALKEKIAAQIPEISVFFGIGKLYPSTADLCRSYQEAKTALELGKFTKHNSNIAHFEDLGIMHLLSSIRYEQLNDFSQEFLADLIAFDEHNKTNLLETLQTYFAENGDSKSIAGKLFIHTNTLRYRLNKIQELLDMDLQNWEDVLNLYTALKINAMLLTVSDTYQ